MSTAPGSPAVRGRGLKHSEVIKSLDFDEVARRARAWIETQRASRSAAVFASPAVRGRGLKPDQALMSRIS